LGLAWIVLRDCGLRKGDRMDAQGFGVDGVLVGVWEGLGERISAAARGAVAVHVDVAVREGVEGKVAELRGTQAEGLLAWVRDRDERGGLGELGRRVEGGVGGVGR